MKIEKDKLPYRQGVIGVIRNKKGQLLVVQMQVYNLNEWRFPGGGVDKGEKPEEALLRELDEELRNHDFQIIRKSKHIIQYDWPQEVIESRFEKKGELFRGQQQTQFLVEYTGDQEEFDFDVKELRQVKWVSKEALPNFLIFENQLEEATKIINELSI